MATDSHRVSRAQEKRTAKRYGGRLQPGSGNGAVKKNDVRNDRFLIENKTKVSPGATQITIKLADLMAVIRNAALDGRTGLLQFDIGKHSFVIAREVDFMHEAGVE